MKRRTLLCVVMTLILLFTAGCGGSGTVSGGTSSGASASGNASSATTSENAATGETDLSAVPEFQQPQYSLGLQDNGFFEGITAADYVTLPEKLTGIEIPADVKTVTDEDVQAQIDEILAEYATDGKIYDRAVENGDQVNIDYVGKIDGVAFEGGNTQKQGTLVTAGATNYIDDFLTQIIGAMPGETVMVEVTFPDPYINNPDLAGKDAVFVTTINYIQGEPVPPELTDDFVKETLSANYPYTDVADMKAKIGKQLLGDQQRVYVLDWLYNQCTFAEAPEQIIDMQNQQLKIDVSNSAYFYNMPLSEVLGYYGFTDLDSMCAAYRSDFVTYAEEYLMCQAVAEKLGVDIGEDDIKAYFTDVVGNPDYSGFLSYYGTGYVSQDVLVHQVSQYLVENAA